MSEKKPTTGQALIMCGTMVSVMLLYVLACITPFALLAWVIIALAKH